MDISGWITRPRFGEYLVAANHDHEAARELYEWNISISSAFFELISHVEVALRNAVDGILEPLEVPESARVDVKACWWFSSSTFLAEDNLKYCETARRHLGRNADLATRDKLLASMTFGLWDDIFDPSYEELFRRHLIYAFPHRGPGFDRKVVKKAVQPLRSLRNRIAHHQAVFDLPLEERYEQAMDTLRWIDPELMEWVDSLCRVRELLDRRPAAAESIAVVVPAANAWPFYVDHGAYICQPGRYFRQVSHVGFYAGGALQSEVPKVLERIDSLEWSPQEIGRRMRGSHKDRKIGELIKHGRDAGWDGDRYQLFLLTKPGADGARNGHVTLNSVLANRRVGRGSAWVQRQRYVSVGRLQSVRSLAELDNS